MKTLRRTLVLLVWAKAALASADTIALVGGTVHPVSGPQSRRPPW